MDFKCCRISRIFSSRVVSAVKGILLNVISKLSSSSSICSNSSIVKSKFCNGFCGGCSRSKRSPDPVEAGTIDADGTDPKDPDLDPENRSKITRSRRNRSKITRSKIIRSRRNRSKISRRNRSKITRSRRKITKLL